MRQCPQELKEFLDKQPMEDKNSASVEKEVIRNAAMSCVGIKSDDEKMVGLFERAEGSEPGDQSWCMDFAQAIIAYCEEILGVKSELQATQGCLDAWNHNPDLRSQDAEVGSIAIWRHGNGPLGHCGIVVEVDGPEFFTVEGNTSDSQEVERTGDGVYRKHRIIGTSGNFTLVGFLRVFP